MDENTKYRKKFFALLEGYGMDKIEQYTLFGGIVNELQGDSNIKIARLKDKVRSAERVILAYHELAAATKALNINLELDK